MTNRARLVVACALAILASCSRSEKPELHDTLTEAGRELRWNKQTSAAVTLKTRHPKPYVLLVLGPGTYTLEQRQALLTSKDAKDVLARHPYVLTPEVPSLYFFAGAASEGDFLHEHFSIPTPLALWKNDDAPLEVLLERTSGDDVRIVGIR